MDKPPWSECIAIAFTNLCVALVLFTILLVLNACLVLAYKFFVWALEL